MYASGSVVGDAGEQVPLYIVELHVIFPPTGVCWEDESDTLLLAAAEDPLC